MGRVVPLSNTIPLVELSRAYGQPLASGVIRSVPEDFYVDELLGFSPSGEGEHVFLQIEKRAISTFAVRDCLARLVGCRQMDIGYAGLKDKWALTRQWFSVYLPRGEEPDWAALSPEMLSVQLEDAEISVHTVARHNKKLRRGAHRGNRFRLRVREVAASCDDFVVALEGRLARLSVAGVPNYFGAQRFGRGEGNVDKARAMFARRQRLPRDQRSLYLSAARSYLFNQILSQRIADRCWLDYLDGDVLILNGSRSHFVLDRRSPTAAADLAAVGERLEVGDIHLAASLCGSGESPLSSQAAERERQVWQSSEDLYQGLRAAGVEWALRPMRVRPEALRWHFEGGDLTLGFELPAGSYATVLLRELIEYED